MKLVAFDYLDVVNSCNKNCFSFSFVLWTVVNNGQFRLLLYCASQHSKPRFSRKTTRDILVKLVAFDYLDVVNSCNKNCFSFSFVLWTVVNNGQFRLLLYCVSQHSKPRFSRKTTRDILVKLVAFDYLDVVDSCNENCFLFSFVLWTGVSNGQFRLLLYCVSRHSKTPFFQKNHKRYFGETCCIRLLGRRR